ncbi:DUF4160 domain-containing protein [candidate division KSB1 bacterium]|nr:MAG: DUF4160 domain-containing protein [candidate division KSB1 bacterium]MBC6951234.1 DUF4160 domain-containing protein [candidate division KSB1 bacterium]MCE7942126.1 DUF4160 domain-containing protein [Chlorobi bacterium CHB1]MDL1873980.1 DUF4160 domain-containing protein [Cytophagia bacterium CHB2]
MVGFITASGHNTRGLQVPRISHFFGISIYMFHNDHPTPHIHVYYGEYGATMNIQPLEVMEGKLSARTLRLVREWAVLHRDELIRNWNRARKRRNVIEDRTAGAIQCHIIF